MIYHSDVTEDMGPMHIVSQQHTQHLRFGISALKRGEHPEVTEHETALVGPAGTLVVWGMQTWHRGSAFRATSGHRYAQFFTYRAARHNWMYYRGKTSGYAAEDGLRAFLVESSPRARELIGFPGVGHDYWNEDTLTGVAMRYPEMDMEPYRTAFAAAR